MGSVQKRYNGDRTYEAVEIVAGGDLVEARAGGVANPGMGLAADVSTKVIGVVQKDANPGGNAPRTPVSGVLDQTLAPPEAKVFDHGFIEGVKYLTAAAYGARLVSAGTGGVKPFVSGTHTADQIVGWCAEKAGVAQNARGLTYINLA